MLQPSLSSADMAKIMRMQSESLMKSQTVMYELLCLNDLGGQAEIGGGHMAGSQEDDEEEFY